MDRENRKIDNRGLTLVELLLAIVILAIITVPLLHSFVSASRVNLDSRKRLRMTTVAQDVMEGLRADTLNELAEEFNDPDATGLGKGFHVLNRNLVNGGSGGISENRCTISDNAVSNLKWVDAAATDVNELPTVVKQIVGGSVSYNFIPRDGSYDAARNDGLYYFTMENVSVENNGNPLYHVDVLVKADANPYRAGGSVSGNDAKHNATSIVSLEDMEESTDCMFSVNLVEECADKGLTTKDVFISNLSITLDHDSLDPTAYVVSMNYDVTRVSDNIVVITDSENRAKNDIRNIYVLYNPTYTHRDRPDNISFTNNTGRKVNLYLVKQYDSTDSAIRTNLNDYEKNYRCKLNINDAAKNTYVRTNLDYNLDEITNNGGALVRMDKAPIPTDRQSTILYNSNPLSDADEAKYINAMGGGTASDRLYDVTVYVYDEGSIADARTNGGNIPASNFLVSIDGSIR